MDYLLEVKNLRKQYKNLTGVDDISFKLKPGICLGLLGPNGAGKTTTIEIIEGLIPATSGEILFTGKPITNQTKYNFGIQLQQTTLQDFVTVKENLQLFKSIYQSNIDLNDLIDKCGLQDFLSKDPKTISGGQKQRLYLALALINKPKILFLDEPTVGLDPQARRNFWSLIKAIKQQNTTIILTTHYMDEATYLCDELIIIDKGKIIASGDPQELVSDYLLEHTVKIPQKDIDINLLSDFKTKQSNGNILLFTEDLNATLNFLLVNKISLKNMDIKSPNLEDLFLFLTGHALRE